MERLNGYGCFYNRRKNHFNQQVSFLDRVHKSSEDYKFPTEFLRMFTINIMNGCQI